MTAPSASQISGITKHHAHLKIATERLHNSAGPLYFAPKEVGETRKRESDGSDERRTVRPFIDASRTYPLEHISMSSVMHSSPFLGALT